MADVLQTVLGGVAKRYRDMGDGTYAEVVALATSPTIDIGDVTLLAGSALVGKVGIDQTTPGTTNAVALAPRATSPLTPAAVSFSASGDNTIVAAVSAQTTKVHRLVLVVTGATALTIKNGAGASLTGAMALGANGAIVFSFDAIPWFVTSANTALIVNSSNAVQVSGFVDSITS